MKINIPEVVEEVRSAFYRYEQALVNNEVEVLDELFWDSQLTLRFGVGENLYGHEAIAKFRAGRNPLDMSRDLMNTKITTYGTDFGTANTEFIRKGFVMNGRQSHTWVRTEKGWRIVAAHVSLLIPQKPGA